nr:MAG TPA: hypothetical protein [Caudoviricetes sp.]
MFSLFALFATVNKKWYNKQGILINIYKKFLKKPWDFGDFGKKWHKSLIL